MDWGSVPDRYTAPTNWDRHPGSFSASASGDQTGPTSVWLDRWSDSTSDLTTLDRYLALSIAPDSHTDLTQAPDSHTDLIYRCQYSYAHIDRRHLHCQLDQIPVLLRMVRSDFRIDWDLYIAALHDYVLDLRVRHTFRTCF
jgi:hypothetical protein